MTRPITSIAYTLSITTTDSQGYITTHFSGKNVDDFIAAVDQYPHAEYWRQSGDGPRLVVDPDHVEWLRSCSHYGKTMRAAMRYSFTAYEGG